MCHFCRYAICTCLQDIICKRVALARPLSGAVLTAQVVPVGVDRAICEIITPVVERSVTIACMTTNELILKDFAFEPDDVRLLNVRGCLTALHPGSRQRNHRSSSMTQLGRSIVCMRDVLHRLVCGQQFRMSS